MNANEQNNQPNPNKEPAPNPLEAKFSTPLKEVVEEFFRSRPNAVKCRTFLRCFRNMIEFLVAEFGHIAIGSVTPQMLDKTLSRWNRQARERGLARMKEFFHWCRSHGYLPPGAPTAADLVRGCVISTEQVNQMLASSALDPQTRMMVVLSCQTGLRWSDLAQLRWNHIRAYRKSALQNSQGESEAA